MSKAKQKALETYPVKIAPRDGYDENLRERKGFIKGYHQAEKDLELGWEDINDIIRIYEDVLETESGENIYIEVLKRFKDYKK